MLIRASPPSAAEQLLEEVTENACTVRIEVASGETGTGAPIGRRLELLAGLPLCTQRVICGAFLGVFQDLVRFSKILEQFFASGLSLTSG